MHTPNPHPDLGHLTFAAKPINAGFWSHGDGFSLHTPEFHQTHMAGTFHHVDGLDAAVPQPSAGIEPLSFEL